MNSILQTIRKLLKIFLFILLGLLALLTILVFRIVTAQMVPKNYTKTFKTGAHIEAAYLLEENERADSIFYQKVDRNNIGISGHSQGGTGVFNAVTVNAHSSLFKTAVALSPTNEVTAKELHMDYDLAKLAVPVLMLAGTSFAVPAIRWIGSTNRLDRQTESTRAKAMQMPSITTATDSPFFSGCNGSDKMTAATASPATFTGIPA